MVVNGKVYGDKAPYGFYKDLGNRKNRFPQSLRPGNKR